MSYKKLVDYLIQENILKTPLIIEAFREIKRKDFLPEDLKDEAGVNAALPIGYGQTISQPQVVAFMLEVLAPQNGEKILDVGAGSGWQSALLSYIVGEKGKVYGIERISELCEFAKKNVRKYGFIQGGRTEIVCADATDEKIVETLGPFDRIIAAAAGREVPQIWKKQLKVGGRIVLPVGNSIKVLDKKSEDKFEEKDYYGFVFVPLIED